MSADQPNLKFKPLTDFLVRLPALDAAESPSEAVACGEEGDGWWVKFHVDIDHELAWETVQELAHVLNDLSLEARLATVFKPMSPPPYLNGGPEEYLSWVIEAPAALAPSAVAAWLEGRLPKPVEDIAAWIGERDEDEDDEEDDDDAEAEA